MYPAAMYAGTFSWSLLRFSIKDFCWASWVIRSFDESSNSRWKKTHHHIINTDQDNLDSSVSRKCSFYRQVTRWYLCWWWARWPVSAVTGPVFLLPVPQHELAVCRTSPLVCWYPSELPLPPGNAPCPFLFPADPTLQAPGLLQSAAGLQESLKHLQPPLFPGESKPLQRLLQKKRLLGSCYGKKPSWRRWHFCWKFCFWQDQQLQSLEAPVKQTHPQISRWINTICLLIFPRKWIVRKYEHEFF